ncbi:MAG TPA: alpha/beta fold hydrolase [Tepidisphaeraceae bacterium]|jgi:alpha-beta hydrolase superfamily lysophospholipase
MILAPDSLTLNAPPRPLKRRRWIRRLTITGAIVVVGWLASSLLVAWLLTHRLGRSFAEPVPVIKNVNVEDVRLPTSDGQQIGGWFVRPTQHQAIFLLLHGNGDSRRSNAALMQSLAEQGYGVLAISLRAHGDSTGSLNDIGWSARYDAIAAVDFVRRIYPAEPLIICGVSLGAATAVYASDELKDRVSAYVLDSLYLDLDSAVRNRLHLFLPPVADWIAYRGLRLWAPCFLTQSIDQYSPMQHLQSIPSTTPVTFLCGSLDDRALPCEGEQMFNSIRSHARLIRFEGAGHGNLFLRDRTKYLQILTQAADDASAHHAPTLPRPPT